MAELSAPVRAAAYVAGLVCVLAGAFGIGRLAGPVDAASGPAHHDTTVTDTDTDTDPVDPFPAQDVLGASVDGYDVIANLDDEVGPDVHLVVTVAQGGQLVTDLGRPGGELGQVHAIGQDGRQAAVASSVDETGSGPDVTFDLVVPRTGRYLLRVEFHHQGSTHVAEFVVGVLVPGGGEDDHEH